MLKHSLITAAILTLCAGASAAELQAGSNTKFEVNVDVGAYYLSTDNGSGQNTGEFKGKGMNQVEIKATHQLPNGVSVFGEIEVDYDPITDNGDLKTDDVRLGFAGPMGRVSIGQFDSFYEDNVAEALGIGHGDTAGFMTEPSSSNDGRHLQYSHKLGDFTVAADYTMSNDATKLKSSGGLAVAGAYKMGDLTLTAGYSRIAEYKSDTLAVNSDKTSTGLSARYQMGPVKLSGLYAVTQARATSLKTRYVGAAVVYTVGDLDLGLSMQRVSPDQAASRNEWAVGVGYNLYKGMQVYLDMNRLDQPNHKDNSIEVGLKYSF